MRIWKTLFLVAIVLLGNGIANALTSNTVAVFYPDSDEPYRSIYQDIIKGGRHISLNKKPPITLKPFLLQKNFKTEEISQQLRNEHINNVIVLGRLGYRLAKSLPKEFNVVSGALPISPNGVSGISLISDPAQLFDYLGQVAPDVKRIHIAYSKRSNWIIELAVKAVKERNLTLNLNKVKNTKEAINFYQNLFRSKIPKNEAIWLPLDRISSHDKIILPFVLEKAWSQDVVVFSSKPSHAKRGVLFSTYPDNHNLGENLFNMLDSLEKQPDQKRFAALSALKLAVNLRTATHLGLKYSRKQKQDFKLTFPK